MIFTSERNGDGNSDLYRVRTNGSDLQELIATPSVEDAGVLSPDGTKLAYVSTANGYKTNIWVLDLTTGVGQNLTNTDAVKGVEWCEVSIRCKSRTHANWISGLLMVILCRAGKSLLTCLLQATALTTLFSGHLQETG